MSFLISENINIGYWLTWFRWNQEPEESFLNAAKHKIRALIQQHGARGKVRQHLGYLHTDRVYMWTIREVQGSWDRLTLSDSISRSQPHTQRQTHTHTHTHTHTNAFIKIKTFNTYFLSSHVQKMDFIQMGLSVILYPILSHTCTHTHTHTHIVCVCVLGEKHNLFPTP